jgi:hypothetical protein
MVPTWYQTTTHPPPPGWVVAPVWYHPGTILLGRGWSQMVERRDVRSGEQTQVGARVDSGIYSAFRTWVEEETGRCYSEVGSALERAMLEHMTEKRTVDRLKRIEKMTAETRALTRQLSAGGVDPDAKKEREKQTIPTGKDPGSRRKRELCVLQAMLRSRMTEFTRETVREFVEDVADVKSKPTVDDYTQSLLTSQAFVSDTDRAAYWLLDEAAVREQLESEGMDVPQPSQHSEVTQ